MQLEGAWLSEHYLRSLFVLATLFSTLIAEVLRLGQYILFWLESDQHTYRYAWTSNPYLRDWRLIQTALFLIMNMSIWSIQMFLLILAVDYLPKILDIWRQSCKLILKYK